MLSSSMLLLNLILLIDVTFSTPTVDHTHHLVTECNGAASTAIYGRPQKRANSYTTPFPVAPPSWVVPKMLPSGLSVTPPDAYPPS